jgi:protein phosphatase
MRKAWEADGDHHDDYGTSLGSWLRSQVIEGNKYIRRWGIKVNSDIGSTLVAGLWDPHNSDLYISHTGDSRAYLWRSNTLYRLTQDHAMDFDTETGAGGAIYYFIGGDSSLFGIDLFQLKVFPGDKVVLCSDGLLYIGESQLAELLRARTALPELAQSMLHRVYDVGAPDNIGICLFEATQS